MYWQKRFDRENPDEAIEKEILNIREEHKDFGYRRIKGELGNRGFKVNKKKVQRIVRKLGLQVTSFTHKSRKYSSYRGKVGKVAPNRINRRFHTNIPHQKITTDTTEFKYYHVDEKGNMSIKKLYLDPFMDMCNSEIISFGISQRPSAENIMKALNEAMENALNFLNNDEYDPLIRVSAFHYLFGYIHPFYNGNGRMSRFISSEYLSSSKVHYLVSLRLSYVIKSHRSQYYSLFKIANDTRNYGDLTCFVIGFLGFIREAGEQVQRFLEEKNEQILHYREIIHKTHYDDNEKDLLFLLSQVSICEGDSLSLKELANLSNISSYLLRKRIDTIEPLLIMSRSGTSKRYRVDLEKLESLQ